MRYEARVGDKVVGFVNDKGDTYRVELPNSKFNGILGLVSFEGATKRNRPNLQVGDCVHCLVATSRRGFEPQLTCATGSGKAWVTGEAELGKLDRDSATCVVKCVVRDEAVAALRAHYKDMKVVAGANGVVWIRTQRTLDTSCVANALVNASKLPADQVRPMVDQLVAAAHAAHTLAQSLI